MNLYSEIAGKIIVVLSFLVIAFILLEITLIKKVIPKLTATIKFGHRKMQEVEEIGSVKPFEKSELFLEIETNATTAKVPFNGKLLPFHTSVWDKVYYQVNALPEGIFKELSEAYTDIKLANDLVWLSEVVDHISQGIEEDYLKLRISIAERLNKIILSEIS